MVVKGLDHINKQDLLKGNVLFTGKYGKHAAYDLANDFCGSDVHYVMQDDDTASVQLLTWICKSNAVSYGSRVPKGKELLVVAWNDRELVPENHSGIVWYYYTNTRSDMTKSERKLLGSKYEIFEYLDCATNKLFDRDIERVLEMIKDCAKTSIKPTAYGSYIVQIKDMFDKFTILLDTKAEVMTVKKGTARPILAFGVHQAHVDSPFFDIIPEFDDFIDGTGLFQIWSFYTNTVKKYKQEMEFRGVGHVLKGISHAYNITRVTTQSSSGKYLFLAPYADTTYILGYDATDNTVSINYAGKVTVVDWYRVSIYDVSPNAQLLTRLVLGAMRRHCMNDVYISHYALMFQRILNGTYAPGYQFFKHEEGYSYCAIYDALPDGSMMRVEPVDCVDHGPYIINATWPTMQYKNIVEFMLQQELARLFKPIRRRGSRNGRRQKE